MSEDRVHYLVARDRPSTTDRTHRRELIEEIEAIDREPVDVDALVRLVTRHLGLEALSTEGLEMVAELARVLRG